VDFLVAQPEVNPDWKVFTQAAREAQVGDEQVLAEMTGVNPSVGRALTSGGLRGLAPSLGGTAFGIPAAKAAFAASLPFAPMAGPAAPAVPFAAGTLAGLTAFLGGAYLTDSLVGSIFGDPDTMTPEARQAFVGAQTSGAVLGALPVMYALPKNVSPVMDNIVGKAMVRLGKMARERPIAAAAVTIPETVGAGAGAYLAQRLYPENEWARVGFEFAGGLSPTATKHVAGNVLDAGGSTWRMLNPAAAESAAGRRILKVFQENAHDHAAIARMEPGARAAYRDNVLSNLPAARRAEILELTDGDVRASLDLASRDILLDELRRVTPGLEVDQSTAQKVPVLLGLQRKLGQASPEFRQQARGKAEETLETLTNLSRVLFKEGGRTGDENLLSMAAMVRQQRDEAALTQLITQAEDDAAKAVAGITRRGTPGEHAEQIGEAVRSISERALGDARDIEKSLYDKLSPKLTTGGGRELGAEYDKLRRDLRILETQSFPSVIEDNLRPPALDVDGVPVPGTGGLYREYGDGLSFGQLSAFRSQMLKLNRTARVNDPDAADQYGHFAEVALDVMDAVAERMGPEHKAAYDAARSFSRALNDTFTRAFAGDVLARTSSGGYRRPVEQLVSAINQSGVASARRRIRELDDAVNFLADQGYAMRSAERQGDLASVVEGVLQHNVGKLVGKDGHIDPQRLNKFIDDNTDLFNRLPPEVKQTFSNAVHAEFLVAEARALDTPAKRSIAARDAFGALLTTRGDGVVPRYPSSVGRAVQEALAPRQGNNPARNIVDMAKLAKEGAEGVSPQEATEGMRRAILDYAELRARRPDGTLSFQEYNDALFQAGEGHPALMDMLGPRGQGIFTREQVAHIKDMMGLSAQTELSLMDPALVDSLLGGDPTGEGARMVQRMAGGKMGGMFANLAGDPNSLLFRAAGSTAMQNVLGRLPLMKQREALKLLMLDPQRAASVIDTLDPTTAVDIAAGERMGAFLLDQFFGRRSAGIGARFFTEQPFNQEDLPEMPAASRPQPRQPEPQPRPAPAPRPQQPPQAAAPPPPPPRPQSSLSFDDYLALRGGQQPQGGSGGSADPGAAAALFPFDPMLAQAGQPQGFAAGGLASLYRGSKTR
jgi:hypothetical protein